jgi:cardiolipin synthase (CMP-forming)
VNLVGKTATLCLLYAFPLVLLGSHAGTLALLAQVIGWAFAIWGTFLYWWAAAIYLLQTRRLASAARAQPPP